MFLRKDASGAAITGIEMINPDSLELGQVFHKDSAAADLYKTSQRVPLQKPTQKLLRQKIQRQKLLPQKLQQIQNKIQKP